MTGTSERRGKRDASDFTVDPTVPDFRELESRMRRKVQVRFGGGRLEKYPSGQLADRLPYKKCGSIRADPAARRLEATPEGASVSSDRRAQG